MITANEPSELKKAPVAVQNDLFFRMQDLIWSVSRYTTPDRTHTLEPSLGEVDLDVDLETKPGSLSLERASDNGCKDLRESQLARIV